MDFLERHPFLTMLAFAILLVIAMCGLQFGTERWQCDNLGRETNRETKYVGAQCYVQQNGQWVREDELAVRGKR